MGQGRAGAGAWGWSVPGLQGRLRGDCGHQEDEGGGADSRTVWQREPGEFSFLIWALVEMGKEKHLNIEANLDLRSDLALKREIQGQHLAFYCPINGPRNSRKIVLGLKK